MQDLHSGYALIVLTLEKSIYFLFFKDPFTVFIHVFLFVWPLTMISGSTLSFLNDYFVTKKMNKEQFRIYRTFVTLP